AGPRAGERLRGERPGRGRARGEHDSDCDHEREAHAPNVARRPAKAKTSANLTAVILFPIALIWLVVALIWIIRNSTNEPDLPGDQPSWRRFVPRTPKRPWNSGSGETLQDEERDRAPSLICRPPKSS